MTAETIHTCSYACERPECIRAQRDELVSRMTAETSNARGEWLQSGGLLYRLTDERQPRNCDEINVMMADGSRYDAEREARASEILALLTAPPPAAARGDVRDVLEKAAWGLYVAWDAVAALEDLQKRGVYAPRCADGKPSRADAGKDLEVIKAAYETVKQALAAEGVQAGEVERALEYLHPHLDAGTFAAPTWAIDLASILTGGAALSQQPEARGVVDELRRTVAAIGVVGEYLGKDTILRESVLDLIDRRLTALTEARNDR